MALGSEPPLSSIDMCLEDVGRTAAEHLLSAINAAPSHGTHFVPCRLVERESSGPPTAQNRLASGQADQTPVAAP
jgi:LacI family transcriptional regulator